MASFLIFIDGHEQSTGQQVLAECGLSSLLGPHDPEPGLAVLGGMGGPSGQGGVLVLPFSHGDERDPPLLFRRDTQQWVKFKTDGVPEYWIGWEKERPPTPRDLARPQQFAGAVLELNHARWMIPFAFATQQRYTIGPDGEPIRKKEPLCQRLYDLAAPAYERLCDDYLARLAGEPGQFNADLELVVASRLLAENYRLDVSIALALGLFTPNDIAKVITFATNPERIAEYQLALGGRS